MIIRHPQARTFLAPRSRYGRRRDGPRRVGLILDRPTARYPMSVALLDIVDAYAQAIYCLSVEVQQLRAEQPGNVHPLRPRSRLT
jgi:hypothetical protein